MSGIMQAEESGLRYRRWEHAAPEAVVLLIHGLGAHSERWTPLAEYFLAHSIVSYAVELKGFGEADGPKGHVDSFSTYFKDIHRLLDIIRKKHGEKKIFLLGESMGGLIAFVMGSTQPAISDGLICLAPAFKSKLSFTPAHYVRMVLTLFYARHKAFPLPFDASMCTRDEVWQQAIKTDTREHRTASPQLLVNIAIQQICAHMVAKEIVLPVLFLLAGQDEIVDSRVSREIFNNLPGDDKLLIEYTKMHHSLSIDLERERVFNDILRWIDKRTQ